MIALVMYDSYSLVARGGRGERGSGIKLGGREVRGERGRERERS